jgi:hypothetical protein
MTRRESGWTGSGWRWTIEDRLVAEPQPLAIEVAVDVYPLDRTAESRPQLIGLLQRHLLPQRVAWRAKNGWPGTSVAHVGDRKNGPTKTSSKTSVIGAGKHEAASAFVNGTSVAGVVQGNHCIRLPPFSSPPRSTD